MSVPLAAGGLFPWSGPCLRHLVAVSSLGALDMFGSDALVCPCGQWCGGPRAEGARALGLRGCFPQWSSGRWLFSFMSTAAPSVALSPVWVTCGLCGSHVGLCCLGPWTSSSLPWYYWWPAYVVLATWSYVRCLRLLGHLLRRGSVVLGFYPPFPLRWKCASSLLFG